MYFLSLKCFIDNLGNRDNLYDLRENNNQNLPINHCGYKRNLFNFFLGGFEINPVITVPNYCLFSILCAYISCQIGQSS